MNHSTLIEHDVQTPAVLKYVQAALNLSEKETKTLQERLWIFSARIRQPRKDDRSCNKTPYFDRWDTNPHTSYLTAEDPRYATEEACKKVYSKSLASLLETYEIRYPPTLPTEIIEKMLGRPFQPQSLKCVHTGQPISGNDIKQALGYATQRLGSYEIPTSYQVELNTGGRHEHTNVGWMKPLHVNHQLRDVLRLHLAQSGVSRRAIKNVLDKIQVKAYCTDKVTMPPYFSNRDVRWATWPDSIQYASHFQCAMIEMELMVQLYEFTGAPLLDDELTSAILEIRGAPILPETRRCFITGRYLNYREYVQAAMNPRSGKSAYHVGHIMPLTRGGKHSWENIAWTSDDGNRIQGNDKREEIEAKLVDAVEYHFRRDMAMQLPPEEFQDKVDRLWNLLNDIREYLGKSKHKW